jgi:hypothetical protein
MELNKQQIKRMIKFDEKFTGTSVNDINNQIIAMCAAVVESGDVSSFSTWFEVDGRPGNWRYGGVCE